MWRDRSLLRARFDDPISTIADRRLGSMLMTLRSHRFASQAYIAGEESGVYFFTSTLQGKASWIQGKNETTVTRTDGAAGRLSEVRRYSAGRSGRQPGRADVLY